MFAIASAVLYSIESETVLPTQLQAAAGAIKVQHIAHATGLDRLVTNMVVSNINAKLNRSMDDPLLLASELGRQGMTSAKEIRSIMKSYKIRIMNSPNLALKRSTEEATIRLMDRGKVGAKALAVLSRIAAVAGRAAPPCQQTHF